MCRCAVACSTILTFRSRKCLAKLGILPPYPSFPQFGTQYTQRILELKLSSTVSGNPPIVGADGSMRPRIFHCATFRYLYTSTPPGTSPQAAHEGFLPGLIFVG